MSTYLDLRKFLHTGSLGPITVGMTRHQIVQALCKPERYGPQRQYETADIWRYGDIELHFCITDASDGTTLEMIFSDHLDWSCNNDQIYIEPWILRTGLTLNDAHAYLLKENLRPKKVERVGLPKIYDLILPSTVCLEFNTEDCSANPVLSCFWYSCSKTR